ncbi:hypothetical protein CNMCM5623_003304 [Aspergillus felis]|uniref:R3H domain-containing protein n=1 Tax=Aspergillus felis TaxID=1287682 RepID=A0A8H6QE40_9EURO|nr:hypothetical protein CNMCM5623_003304 [Aspergillus felis]
MSGSPVATADNNTPRPKAARRRGRGRGGRGSLRSMQTAPNTQPEAQETPQVPANEAPSLNVQPNESLRPARGSRGGKRGGRGVGASQDNGRRRGRGRGESSNVVNGGLGGRTFEGRLSKPERASDEDQPDDTGDLSLRADAPEFVPGAPTNGAVHTGLTSSADTTTGKGKSKNVQPRPPKVTTKSTAPDIATRIHEDIAHNLYECPICTSELGRRNGQRMKDRPPRMLRVARQMGSPVHRVPGAALAVIFPTRSSLPPIPVGVRRKSTPVRFLACPLTRAAKPAHDHAKAVRIRAMRLAMLVLVHLVPQWARLKIVSVGGIRRRSAARIQITRMVGAVGRYAVTYSPAANTLVQTEMLCSSKDEEFESQLARGDDAAASKGPIPQATRGPSLTPLTCDDECARLERNRALASALGVEIDPSTTVASNISPNTLPYSTETLDMYVQLSSTSPLSTLQTYESTLHSLATSTTQRSVRFQPAKSPLRAFIHSLAADWGFASESFDPEPHRHVFVLKPTTWTPPLLGFGPENSIGIGGKSVGECVKLRERQRLKEREAQRLAAAEAKALKEAAKAQQSTDTASDGGWAQVAASRRSNGVSSTRSTTPVASPSPWSVSKFAALAGGDSGSWGLPKKEKLVLRSGVGAAKKNLPALPATEVADNWEEEEEKVEQEEEREREREQQSDGEAQPEEENNELTDATDSVEMPAEAAVSTD